MELLGRAFRDMGIATALAGLWRQYLKGCRRHVFQVRRVAVCVVMMLDLKMRINWLMSSHRSLINLHQHLRLVSIFNLNLTAKNLTC